MGGHNEEGSRGKAGSFIAYGFTSVFEEYVIRAWFWEGKVGKDRKELRVGRNQTFNVERDLNFRKINLHTINIRVR